MSHFLQSGLQEICCFIECHPTCQFRILFLPVRMHKTKANPNAKQHPSIQLFTLCTVQLLHEYRLPEKSELLNTG